ncbi:MAG TPA: hypothetical protein VNB22_23075 [Pyrinomonadaceae bacterium]|jgi:hypothetical protein|nr:hypothetical protein [Pyrinomonadaceae bacterium]
MKKHLTKFLLLIFLAVSIGAQTEILTNATVLEMSKIGLDKQIILKKINETQNNFDTSANALIELKKAGVADDVIALILEKSETKIEPSNKLEGFSETLPNNEAKQFLPTVVNAKDALLNAKTVAIEKSSLNPSRQELEKALFKRKEWQKYNLTLTRYKKDADIYIEIGFVPLSWITHRYVFRIYDRRSGTIITAGETTSWGSLAEHLAREITQKMDTVSGK